MLLGDPRTLYTVIVLSVVAVVAIYFYLGENSELF